MIPIPYIIKKNRRSRHVILRMSQQGLELTVPMRFNQKNIPTILEQHKSWIEKHYQIMQERKVNRDELPSEIALLALQQTWKIHYMQSQSQTIEVITRPHHELVLLGNVQDKLFAREILFSWLREQAKTHLIPWLNHLSDTTQLRFTDVGIRSQQSRWGSCSHAKKINLNDRLLFLPPHLVSHIMIHELCHTRHLNHSARFWELVAKFDPQSAENRRLLRKTKHFMPNWCE